MINQTIVAVLLVIPLITMIIPSIRYWSEFKKEKKKKAGKKTKYNKAFFYLFVAGVLCMWMSWVGGILFLFLNKFYSIFGFLTFSSPYETAIQIAGLIIFYIGSVIYNLNIIVAGKYLRPSTSGTLEEHKLIKEGPFAVIRHPLYVSYIFILAGLSLILFSYWLLIPTLCVIIGIYPMAKAEEETLIEQFGEEYLEYKEKLEIVNQKKLPMLSRRNGILWKFHPLC